MNQLVTRDDAAPLPTRRRKKSTPPTVGNMLAAIARAASDPAVDVGKMRELLAMQREILAEHAKMDAAEAKARVLELMPRITKRGEIIITERAKGAPSNEASGTRKIIQRTKYAKYEDIDKIIRPILAEHGFTLTHTTSANPAGGLLVTGVLKHKGPHGVFVETSEMPLPLETSGSKNNVQGVGSSMSYGRRYTTTALLNLIFEGEDDDGNGGSKPPELLTDEQVAELSQLMTAAGAKLDLFLEAYEIPTLGDLPADKFEHAKERIRAYQQRRQQGGSRQ
jgi:ERF superfamily